MYIALLLANISNTLATVHLFSRPVSLRGVLLFSSIFVVSNLSNDSFSKFLKKIILEVL